MQNFGRFFNISLINLISGINSLLIAAIALQNQRMKRKPWSLILLAILYCLSPLGNIVANAFWAPMPALIYIRYAFQWPNMVRNWPEFIFPLIAAAAIYLCRRWSFYIYIVAMMSLLISSYIGYHGRMVAKPLQLVVVYLINIVLVAYFLIPRVRRVYFDPRLRWWEADRRFRFDHEATVIAGQNRFSGLIGNISKSGLFMKSQQFPQDREQVLVEFTFQDTSYQFSGGAILHASQSLVGFGLKFTHTPQTAKKIKILIQALEQEGRLIGSRLPSEEDRFLFWVKNLIKTGNGLLPDKIDKKP
jgi:hypothetical protein